MPPVHVHHHVSGESSSKIHAAVASKFEPQPWTNFFDFKEKIHKRIPVYQSGKEGVIFLCLHGAGHSALSFAVMAKAIRDAHHRLVAFDWPGHGDHEDVSPAHDSNSLVQEGVLVVEYLVKKYPEISIVLVGHSLGGAIGAKLSAEICNNHEKLARQLKGIVIIDVCEGSALEALPHMENIVLAQPKGFTSLQSAISYVYKSHQVRNLESAQVSVAGMVKQVGEKEWTWRADLMSTKACWAGWFKGMNEAFLGTGLSKAVILAERERIDKDFIIAQHMGKFKAVYCKNVGHLVHEDDPGFMRDTLMDFLTAFKIGTNINAEKVIVTASGKKVVIH